MKKFWLLVISLLVAWIFLAEQLELGWGYSVRMEGDTRTIYRHGEVIVDRDILDARVDSGYLVGIRLPTKDIDCNFKLIRAVIDQPTYFILKLDETKVTSFLSKEEFESRISSLNIKFEDPLKYEFFGNIFKNAKRLDNDDEYNRCLSDNNLDSYRVAALF